VALALTCPSCAAVIPSQYWNDSEENTCRGCSERIIARVFPAHRVNIEAALPPKIEIEGDASCFYHAANRAHSTCAGCGRFLCTLCDIDLDGRHLCPGCVERGVKVEKAGSLEQSRTLYDSMALGLTIWPWLTFWGPLITAPVALYLIVRHWNTPLSILRRSKFRFWLALVLALADIAVFVVLIGSMISAMNAGRQR
jgi:hypothetical protein